MFKINGKELKENDYKIEITKGNVSSFEYDKEIKKFIEENKYEELTFSVEFLYNEEKSELEFSTNKPNEELLNFPLNEYVNFNNYIDDNVMFYIGESYSESLTFDQINFYLKRLNNEEFIIKIVVDYEYQEFQSLDITLYKFELEFGFNLNQVETDLSKNNYYQLP